MGKFLETEKIKQAQFKATSPLFSDSARADGVYKGKPRVFCLPVELTEQNLVPEIRETAVSHFAEHRIKWHDGQTGKQVHTYTGIQVTCLRVYLCTCLRDNK